MFTLIYLVRQAVLPPTVILLLLLAGFLLGRGSRRRVGMAVLALGIVLYTGLSLRPTAHLLLAPLEAPYPPLAPDKVPHQGTIVVLGGGIWSRTDLPAASQLSRTSVRRLAEAVRIYHLMGEAEIVVSGGKGNPFLPLAEAPVMRDFLVSLGIAEGKIIVEADSRTTFENVERLRNLPLRRPLILVTSASHMLRALGVFNALGEEPLPAPCDRRGLWEAHDPSSYLPSAEALGASTSAVYEYLGLAWYRLCRRL
jgi:uncharacterized SAM-binding protein YcdF (DUF218 family)